MSDGLFVCVCPLCPRGDTCINIQYHYSNPFKIIIMPVYIYNSHHQFTEIMTSLTQDYLQQIKIHVCKMRHRDVDCTEYSEILHDGQHPTISIVYVTDLLGWSTQFLIDEMMNNLPDFGDNNNRAFIHTCPGCGVPYAQQ